MLPRARPISPSQSASVSLHRSTAFTTIEIAKETMKRLATESTRRMSTSFEWKYGRRNGPSIAAVTPTRTAAVIPLADQMSASTLTSPITLTGVGMSARIRLIIDPGRRGQRELLDEPPGQLLLTLLVLEHEPEDRAEEREERDEREEDVVGDGRCDLGTAVAHIPAVGRGPAPDEPADSGSLDRFRIAGGRERRQGSFILDPCRPGVPRLSRPFTRVNWNGGRCYRSPR